MEHTLQFFNKCNSTKIFTMSIRDANNIFIVGLDDQYVYIYIYL